MKVVDISNIIYINQGSPSTTSVAAIAFWIRSQIGRINNLLFEDFEVDEAGGTYEILDGGGVEITPEAVSIIEQLYKLYDYDLQIRSNINAISTSSILRVEDDGSVVQKTNRNEVAKNLGSLKSAEQKVFNDLVTAYRMKKSGPQDVSGDDTVPGYYGEISVSNLRTPYY